MAPLSRLSIYGLLSTSLFAAVTLSALKSRPNFYAAAVSVGRSSGSMMILANFGLWLGILLGVGVKTVFFGALRSVEAEHLFERLWMFLTESLLALTIFRDDFSTSFVVMYGLLVFLKCFHWITADRVDYIDQIPPPGPPTLFHIRAGTIITLLFTFDVLLVCYSLYNILTDGVSSTVLFASEFMILLASIWGTMARYAVSCFDLRRARGREDAPAWEEKSMYMFYIDLAVDFAKLITYLMFFSVILLNYGIPLHILRDVWMTFRSFASRCSDLVRYRRATRDMDAQYPNATEEDVGRLGDRVCIICREEMNVRQAGQAEVGAGGRHEGPNETPKRLVCGHVFHFHCLRSWLERQQSCPTCRRDVLHNPMQNTRHGRAAPAPAPPAPGAAPRPQANAVPAEQLRAQFNEFFRQPQENGALPQGAAAAAPPAPGNHNLASAVPTPTAAATDTPRLTYQEEELHRSIWGGPIRPGQFFGAPLGAIPQHSCPRSPSSSSRPRPSTRPVRISDVASDGLIEPSLQSARPTVTASSYSASEVNTPFSSNPPEVFRPISRSPDSSTAADDGDAAASTEVRSRRMAAEAAMKRLGINLPTPQTPPSNDAPSSKGKEKARTPSPLLGPENANGSSAPNQVTDKRVPFLSIASRHLPHVSLAGQSRLDMAGVDDRLRTLTAVDDTIWQLIEDLTKLRSQWEASPAEEGIAEDDTAVGRT